MAMLFSAAVFSQKKHFIPPPPPPQPSPVEIAPPAKPKAFLPPQLVEPPKPPKPPKPLPLPPPPPPIEKIEE